MGGGNKTIPKKKKSEKAKWLSEEALQIAKERREAKSKGERERYIQLNADFQRTAQRYKKAFFNEQCIKLEENNRRGKTRYLFRKIGDIKGTFCPRGRKSCSVDHVQHFAIPWTTQFMEFSRPEY